MRRSTKRPGSTTSAAKRRSSLFISRFRAKARLANMVQSRVKTLAKMEKKDKLEQTKNLDFSFRSKPFGQAGVHG